MEQNGNPVGYFERYISSETSEGKKTRARLNEFFIEHEDKPFKISQLCDSLFECGRNRLRGASSRDISDVVLSLTRAGILEDVSKGRAAKGEYEYCLAVELGETYRDTVLGIIRNRGETPLLGGGEFANDCDRILDALCPTDTGLLDGKVVAQFNGGKAFKGIGVCVIQDGGPVLAYLKNSGAGRKYIVAKGDGLAFADEIGKFGLKPAFYPIKKEELAFFVHYAGATTQDIRHGTYMPDAKHFISFK